jgi:hypothetical protein
LGAVLIKLFLLLFFGCTKYLNIQDSARGATNGNSNCSI